MEAESGQQVLSWSPTCEAGAMYVGDLVIPSSEGLTIMYYLSTHTIHASEMIAMLAARAYAPRSDLDARRAGYAHT